MKKFINNLKADRFTSRGFVFSIILLLITIIFIFINYPNLPPLIPVFNQLPWGPQRLTPTIGIFIPVLIFIFALTFNLFFSSVVYSKNALIARIVAATTLILAIINFLFIVRTIFITI